METPFEILALDVAVDSIAELVVVVESESKFVHAAATSATTMKTTAHRRLNSHLIKLADDTHHETLDDRPASQSDQHHRVEAIAGDGLESGTAKHPADTATHTLDRCSQEVAHGEDELAESTVSRKHSKVEEDPRHQNRLDQGEDQQDNPAQKTGQVETARRG